VAFKIEKYERIFLYLTVVTLVLGVVAIVLSVAEAGIHLPTKEGRIDPTKVRETAPFDNPGVFEVAPGEYEAVMIAQAWAFQPATVEVPAGSEVTFIATATDVIHGILIWDTAVNAMVIPGQITRITHTFDEPGEYQIVCHEYCGIGHAAMFGRVVVTG
jgi:cytochrome c oxidase subunit II